MVMIKFGKNGYGQLDSQWDGWSLNQMQKFKKMIKKLNNKH